MTVAQIRNLFLTDPEFRIELILANNPEGVLEALTVNNYLSDSEQSEEAVRAKIFELIVQNRLTELDQLLAIVPIDPGNLAPNAVTALVQINAMSMQKQFTGPPMENGQFVSNQGGEGSGPGFDWSNMQAWGQVFNGLGGLFGLGNGTQQTDINFDPNPPAPAPAENPVTLHLKMFWPYYVAAIGAAVAIYLYNKKK